MAKGGKRPGSGSKPGVKRGPYASTLKKAETQAIEREKFRDFLTPHLERLHAAQVSNAQGLAYLVAREKKTGKFVRLSQEQVERILDGKDDTHEAIELWHKDPSSHAYAYLMDQFLDKPRQQEQAVAVTGKLVIEIAKGW